MLAMQSNEIKSRLSEILRKVEAGQEVAITRHGKLIARLSPWNDDSFEQDKRIKAVQMMRAFKKHRLASGESVIEMRDEGRR